MVVYQCHKMLCVFPPNIVVRLPVLQSLSIEKCDSLRYIFYSSTVMLEVIVKEEDEDEDEAAEDKMNKLVFPSLISMKLILLLNLMGISSGMLCFEWPLLTSLEINFCWKMRIFTSGCSTTPILDRVIIDSCWHNVEGDANTTFMSVKQKDFDNLAFKEDGMLTISGFLIAGEHLVTELPSWSWELGEYHKKNLYLRSERQFLIAINVPCLRRARASSSKVVVEKENGAGECSTSSGSDDKNIPRPRTYDVSITYNETHRTPRLWLTGYDDESKMLLPLKLVLEDIAEFYPRELVTVNEYHPHLAGTHYLSTQS